jgi:hypothetical protein
MSVMNGDLVKEVEKNTKPKSALDDLQGDVPVESNISKTITDTTTKIVIIIILSSLFILPFFELTTFAQPNSSLNIGYNLLTDFNDQAKLDPKNFNFTVYEQLHQYFIADHGNKFSFNLVYYQLPFDQNFTNVNISKYRNDELESGIGDESYIIHSDIPTWNNKVESIINIARTIMVCLLLGGSSYFFNKDT